MSEDPTTKSSNTKCSAKIINYDSNSSDLVEQCVIQHQQFSSDETIVYCETCKNCFSLAGWQVALEEWGGTCKYTKEDMVVLAMQSTVTDPGDDDESQKTVYNEYVPHLDYEINGERSRCYVIEDEVTFGREKSCSITLTNRKVSRLHARIVKDKHGFKLFNESPNGTMVNQQRIGMKGSVPLQDGDRIKIADVVFEFVNPDSANPKAYVPSDEPWKLVYHLEGSVKHAEKYRLSEEEVSIGRRGDQTIQIEDDAVSREHARIFYQGEHYYIEDLGSANGVNVDGRRLEPHRPETLKEGTRIKMGRHIFHFSQKPINTILEEIGTPSNQAHDQTIPSLVVPEGDTTMETDDRSQAKPTPISANPGWPAIVGLITLAILLSLVMGGFAFLLGQNLPEPLANLFFGTPTSTATPTPTASLVPTFTATMPLTTTPAGAAVITDTPTASPTPTATATVTPVSDVIEAQVVADALNVRGGPGPTYPIITTVSRGDTLVLLRQNEAGDWMEVQTPDDQVGWVSRLYIDVSTAFIDLPVADDFPPAPPRTIVDGGLAKLELPGPSVSGELQPGQEKWFIFSAPEGRATFSVLFTPDVNRIQDDFRFVLHDEDQVPSWPPGDPPILKLASDREPATGGGKLIWEGTLDPNAEHYIRIINESDREVDYCLAPRNESDWTCR